MINIKLKIICSTYEGDRRKRIEKGCNHKWWTIVMSCFALKLKIQSIKSKMTNLQRKKDNQMIKILTFQIYSEEHINHNHPTLKGKYLTIMTTLLLVFLLELIFKYILNWWVGIYLYYCTQIQIISQCDIMLNMRKYVNMKWKKMYTLSIFI